MQNLATCRRGVSTGLHLGTDRGTAESTDFGKKFLALLSGCWDPTAGTTFSETVALEVRSPYVLPFSGDCTQITTL